MSFYLDHLAYTGAADRFAKNIVALELLHRLESECRAPTEDERRRLAHYSAFGESANLNKLFGWNQAESRYALQPQYTSLLSAADAQHLRRAALTAFYTPLDVVGAIWRAVERLGIGHLPQPRIIEPALGVGHFISAMPPALRASAEITAVELDPVSARIARQIHPDITLHGGVGFQAVEFPTNWFDLAISNVPFGDMAIHDPLVDPPLRRTIHDYFFAKALRIVRPGGLVVFLSSWGTLDKATRTVRRWLATHADLLGAFRLPNGVFHAMSGSQSATDLLILQKKAVPTDADVHWLAQAEADYPRTTDRNLTTGSRYTREIKDADELAAQRVSVNQLWLQEPERVIGSPCIVVADNSLWLQVKPPHGGIAATLDAQMRRLLPEGVVHHRDDHAMLNAGAPEQPAPRPVTADVLTLPPFDAAREARATALAAIYTAAKTLIKRELNDDPDVERTREQLNTVYDQFVRQWGAIHDPRTQRLFRDVPELAFLLALECNPRQDTRGRWRADKERIFRERTLRPVQGVLPGSLTPTEALLHCLDERGQLDLPRIAELCGQDVPQTVAALGDRIFPLPGTARYELADVYLSGNVRAKLREAQTWAERDAAWERNVAALEAIQPTPLGPGEIIVNLNAVWLPNDVVTDFIKALLPRFVGDARYNHSLGEWRITDTYNAGMFSVEARSKWGTKRVNAMDILEASLKGIPITVYDEIKVGDSTKRVLNPAETVAAQEKQEEIKRHWEQWIWAEPDRVTPLCQIYNERFNSIRMRSYNGQHLSFPGMATHILRDGDLAAYQKDAVWQILQSPSALLAFAVGGGKTFTSIAAIAEAKRMGLVNKPLAVVPNNLVGQWANEARRLYPGMRVLAMGPEDFEKARRSTVLSRIATGDWDLVIVAETSAKFLPLGEGLLDAFRDKETDRLRAYLEELRATATGSDEKRSLKQIERAVAKLEARFDSMAAAIRRDSDRAITWRELGIDMLVVDEAHRFPYETPVLTDRGWLPIGKIVDERIPAKVLSCNTATQALEWKPITDWFNNPVTAPIVRVEHAHGSFECTANHKIWTEEDGYVAAEKLQPHHHLHVLREAGSFVNQGQTTGQILQSVVCRRIQQTAAHREKILRGVWKGICVPFQRRAQQRKTTVLWQPLRGSLALQAAGPQGNIRKGCWASSWCSRSREEESIDVRTYEGQQSDEQYRSAREDAPIAQGPYVSRAWRQRYADATTTALGGSDGLSDGVCHSDSAGSRTVSIAAQLLQGRSRRSNAHAGDRGRRQDASPEAVALSGQAQDGSVERARVVGVTVLERAGDDGSAISARDYSRVYCLEVADHHNFFADGVLVSNCFKNLSIPSKLTNIAGLPRGNSQRALDMRIKTWDVLQHGGKVVFLTATPIMNTLGEAYVMQLFLQEAMLEAAGIHHFDEWVSLYAQPRMSFEMKPDGSGFRMNTRLNTFVNLPEMSAMWRQVMNVRTKQQMGLPEPELVTGKPIPVVVPPSAALKRFVQSLGERAERIRRGQVDPSTDNMLKITSEGRKAALDMRLVFPGTKRRARCKIGELVTRVKLVYDTFAACKGTQIVFCDLATPKGASESQSAKKSSAASSTVSEDDADGAKAEVETTEETRWANFVYYEIRDELMQRGIREEEIAFIHDYKTKEQRDALFAAMNDGRVRVLLGSTVKMSTGMNVQRRLVALHDLDCPWRPGDLEQRHGRIQRQGNLWPEVYIFAYITEGSFDGFLWQTVESKARFIAQAMAGEITARSIEDTSDVVLSAAEVKAIASGNPKIVRKVQLETEIGRMERVRAVHRDTEVALRMDRRQAERRIVELQARADVLHAAHGVAAAASHDSFRADVATQLGHHTLTTFTRRSEAGEALRRIVEHYEAAAAFQRDTITWVVGRYRGFELRLKVHPHVNPELVLRLPDGAPVGALTLRTDTGVFQSADSLLANLPESQRQVAAHLADTEQRIREIDAELGRMAVWDGQAAYDAARDELKAINDDFAALEQATHAVPAGVSDAAADSPAVEEYAATDTLAPEIIAAVTALLDDDEDALPPEEVRALFPPALRSLAWMEAEMQRVVAVHAFGNGEDVSAIDVAAEALDESAEHTMHAALSEITEPAALDAPVWKEVPVVAPKRRRQGSHAAVGVQLAFF